MEVVQKADEVKNEIREQRQTLLEDQPGVSEVVESDIIADKVSLDLDDLEDLNNEAFADTGPEQSFANQGSPPAK